MKKIKKVSLSLLLILAVLYMVLLIPDPGSNNKIVQAGKKPFFWNRDNFWQLMEENFKHAKQMPPAILDSSILQKTI
jgi:hypothetical protein